jgi:hypothetical protein
MNVWTNMIAAGATGVLAAALGVAQNQQQAAAPPYGPPLATASVILSNTTAGCDKTLIGNGNDANPNTIPTLHARNGSVVRWTVYNMNCSAPVVVTINFVGTSPGPPGEQLTCTVQMAQPFCLITMPVRNDATGSGPTTYTYHMLINGTQKDPDIIIDP